MSSDDVNKGRQRFPAATTSDSFPADDMLMIGVGPQGAP